MTDLERWEQALRVATWLAGGLLTVAAVAGLIVFLALLWVPAA